MNQPPGHLTDAQIKDYVMEAASATDTQRWLEAHITGCQACLDRLLVAERIHLGLLKGNGMKQTPYPGCPTNQTLQELAAGNCAPENAAKTTEHAAHCDHCGPLLQRYLSEFSDDVQSADTAMLARLETATPQWQNEFIQNYLTGGAKPPKEALPQKELEGPKIKSGSRFGWFGFWPRLVTASAGAAMAIGAFVLLRGPSDFQQAQQLVAAAYGEQRTIEMRLTDVPYAKYDPLPKERAAGADSLTYRRPSFYKAGAAIGDKLKSNPSLDSRWMQLKGRVALLDATPESVKDAEQDLEKAQAEGKKDPSLEIDLAASHFEAAITEDNPDLASTINLLKEALASSNISNQQRLVGLFDLAVVYQKSRMLDQAIPTWEQYLKLDPSSKWADEARHRLQEAKSFPQQQSKVGDAQKPFFF